MAYKEKIEATFGTTLNFFKSIKKTEDTAISFDSKFNNSKYELSKAEKLLIDASFIAKDSEDFKNANQQFLDDCRPKAKKTKKATETEVV